MNLFSNSSIGKIFFLIIVISGIPEVHAQGDLVRWGKQEISYELPGPPPKRDYSFDTSSPFRFVAKSFILVYWIIISDVDGDHCPFTPSCSSFLVEGIKETNIIQGTLMFADRLTRDTDAFGRDNRYPRYMRTKKYYDPAFNYTLHAEDIHFYPAHTAVQ